LRQAHHRLEIATQGRGMVEVTQQVTSWLSALEPRPSQGLLTLFIQHTSASLLVQENADPDVQGDLDRFLGALVEDGSPLFRHRDEGADDMSAHVRTALTQVHLSIPVIAGRLALGTWQGIYLFEHRTSGHRRRIQLHFLGE
jgi:secondary thiamine-phosphate synthase enzyme